MVYWFETEAGEIDDYEGLESTADPAGIAIDKGVFDSRDEYYSELNKYLVETSKSRIERKHREKYRDLIHAIRTYDELEKISGSLGEGMDQWREESIDREQEIIGELSGALGDIEELRDDLEEYIGDRVVGIAPNLSNIAGPILTARLIEQAGGLKELARMPSSTLQVLGAEDALFQHLAKDTPPPKHGLIYMHPYVRETESDKRGSVSRMLAGKLSIAARIDYYSGDIRDELEREVDEKVMKIRER